ncbi:MAG: hypothetical protein K5650_03120 [Bacteroidales bacterium]|nr:hypothetical protein [Bacteroidales bacterium]
MNKNIFLAIVLALTLSSCGIYYKPQAVDIPLINHQGDLRIDGSLSLSTFVIFPSSMGAHLTASYGITDHIAGQVYLSTETLKGGMGHLAVGGYLPLDKFVLEGYLGAGWGYAPGSDNANEPPETAENSSILYTTKPAGGQYATGFLQFNAGWVGLAKGHIDLGFGLKGGVLKPDFADNRWSYNSSTDSWSCEAKRYTSLTPIAEPQLMFRVGGENLKFTIKAGLLFASEAEFVYSNVTLALGMNYRF